MRASATVCFAEDWYDTFVGFQEITHVITYDTLAESLLNTLGLTSTGSDTDDDDEVKQRGNGVPLFQELVSLTVGNMSCGWITWTRKGMTTTTTTTKLSDVGLVFFYGRAGCLSPGNLADSPRSGCPGPLLFGGPMAGFRCHSSRTRQIWWLRSSVLNWLLIQRDTECNTNFKPCIVATAHEYNGSSISGGLDSREHNQECAPRVS